MTAEKRVYELSECEKREMEAYGDGYMAGAAEILKRIQDAIDTVKLSERLPAVERILQDYGVREADEETQHD